MDKNPTDNPFSAPAARVSDYGNGGNEDLLTDPRAVEVGRGYAWVGESWGVYKEYPGIWSAIALVFGIINGVLGAIPILGLVSYVLMPVFFGGMMLGCDAIRRGEDLRFEHLFAGFQNNFGKLMVAGLLYIAGFIVIVIVAAVGMGASIGLGAMAGGGGMTAAAAMSVLLWLAVCLGLSIPLMMAVWFAPVLIVLHDMPAMEAMSASFKGCLRNWLPFLLFGILTFILAIFATLPILLGWLVFGPMMIASQYVAYRDIFVE